MPTTLTPKNLADLITVVRASSATRINEQGDLEVVAANLPRIDHDPNTKVTNLCTQSEFGDGFASTPTRGGLISLSTMEGYAGAVAFAVPTSVAGYAYKAGAVVDAVCTFSCVIEMDDNLGPPVSGSQGATSDYGIMIAGSAPAAVTVAPLGNRRYRAWGSRLVTSSTNLGNTGVVKWAGNSGRTFKVSAYQIEARDVPGQYVPTAASVASRALALGMLMEEARTNLVPRSEALTPSSGGVEATTMLGFPAGALSFPASPTATNYTISNFVPPASTVVTISAFIEMADGSAPVLGGNNNPGADLGLSIANSVPGLNAPGYSVTPAGKGRYRVAYTGTTSDTPVNNHVGLYRYVGQSGKAFKVSGLQCEVGSFASSYIPTNGTAATRARDDAIIPVGPWFNLAEGTFFGEVFNSENVNARIIFSADNAGVTTNRMLCYLSSATPAFVINRDNVTQMSANGPVVPPRSLVRAALAYKTDDSAFSVNGSAPVTRTSCSLPTAITRITLGGRTAAGADQLNGHIRAFDYYPKRLPNDELKALTT